MINFKHPMVTPEAAARCIAHTLQDQLADVRHDLIVEMADKQNDDTDDEPEQPK